MKRALVFAGLAAAVAASCVRTMKEPEGCETDADCVDGQVCRKNSKYSCVFPEDCTCRSPLWCEQASDCDAGLECVIATNTCTPPTPVVCGDGLVRAGNVCVQALVYTTAYEGVAQLGVKSDGTLVQVAAPATAGTGPNELAATPDARFLYVANTSGSISQFAIQQGGALAPLSPSTVPVEGSPHWVGVEPSGRYAYAIDNDGAQVSQFAIGVAGTLSPVAAPLVVPATSPYSGGFHLTGMLDPSGTHLYIADAHCSANCIFQFAIADGGALVALSPPAASVGPPIATAMHPTGRSIFVALNNYTIARFAIADSGALLTPALKVIESKHYTRHLAVHPSGSTLYVASSSANAIDQYGVDPDGGVRALTPASVHTATAPQFLAVDPDGRYLYARTTSSAVYQFAIGDGGLLEPLSPASADVGSGQLETLVVRPH